jgi:hypothetical protein
MARRTRAHELARIAYFVVHPHWIRYSDCDQNPPFIQEVRKEALSYDF